MYYLFKKYIIISKFNIYMFLYAYRLYKVFNFPANQSVILFKQDKMNEKYRNKKIFLCHFAIYTSSVY